MSVFAQYTVRVPDRDRVRDEMARAGIPTAVHYPVPLHHQVVFAALGYPKEAFPHASQAAAEVISLPMHPYLSAEQQQWVAQALLQAVA